MKVQFEAGGVRLRITRAELLTLRTTGSLATALHWPGGAWRIEVVVAVGAGAVQDGTLRVAFTAAELEAFEARLPSRDGLQRRLDFPTGPIDVRLEVDLHDGRSRAR